MSQFCNYCGAPLNGTETICTHCGAPVAASNTVAQDTTVLNTDFKQSLGGEETTVLNNGENGFNPHTNSAYQSRDNFGAPPSGSSSQYNAGAYQNTPPNGYTAPNYNQNYNYGNYGSAYGPSNPNIGVIETPQHGFVESYRLFWENYVNFNGRSRRSDYWNVFLWNIIINGVFDSGCRCCIFRIGSSFFNRLFSADACFIRQTIAGHGKKRVVLFVESRTDRRVDCVDCILLPGF